MQLVTWEITNITLPKLTELRQGNQSNEELTQKIEQAKNKNKDRSFSQDNKAQHFKPDYALTIKIKANFNQKAILEEYQKLDGDIKHLKLLLNIATDQEFAGDPYESIGGIFGYHYIYYTEEKIVTGDTLNLPDDTTYQLHEYIWTIGTKIPPAYIPETSRAFQKTQLVEVEGKYCSAAVVMQYLDVIHILQQLTDVNKIVMCKEKYNSLSSFKDALNEYVIPRLIQQSEKIIQPLNIQLEKVNKYNKDLKNTRYNTTGWLNNKTFKLTKQSIGKSFEAWDIKLHRLIHKRIIRSLKYPKVSDWFASEMTPVNEWHYWKKHSYISHNILNAHIKHISAKTSKEVYDSLVQECSLYLQYLSQQVEATITDKSCYYQNIERLQLPSTEPSEQKNYNINISENLDFIKKVYQNPIALFNLKDMTAYNLIIDASYEMAHVHCALYSYHKFATAWNNDSNKVKKLDQQALIKQFRLDSKYIAKMENFYWHRSNLLAEISEIFLLIMPEEVYKLEMVKLLNCIDNSFELNIDKINNDFFFRLSNAQLEMVLSLPVKIDQLKALDALFMQYTVIEKQGKKFTEASLKSEKNIIKVKQIDKSLQKIKNNIDVQQTEYDVKISLQVLMIGRVICQLCERAKVAAPLAILSKLRKLALEGIIKDIYHLFSEAVFDKIFNLSDTIDTEDIDNSIFSPNNQAQLLDEEEKNTAAVTVFYQILSAINNIKLLQAHLIESQKLKNVKLKLGHFNQLVESDEHKCNLEVLAIQHEVGLPIIKISERLNMCFPKKLLLAIMGLQKDYKDHYDEFVKVLKAQEGMLKLYLFDKQLVSEMEQKTFPFIFFLNSYYNHQNVNNKQKVVEVTQQACKLFKESCSLENIQQSSEFKCFNSFAEKFNNLISLDRMSLQTITSSSSAKKKKTKVKNPELLKYYGIAKAPSLDSEQAIKAEKTIIDQAVERFLQSYFYQDKAIISQLLKAEKKLLLAGEKNDENQHVEILPTLTRSINRVTSLTKIKDSKAFEHAEIYDLISEQFYSTINFLSWLNFIDAECKRAYKQVACVIPAKHKEALSATNQNNERNIDFKINTEHVTEYLKSINSNEQFINKYLTLPMTMLEKCVDMKAKVLKTALKIMSQYDDSNTQALKQAITDYTTIAKQKLTKLASYASLSKIRELIRFKPSSIKDPAYSNLLLNVSHGFATKLDSLLLIAKEDLNNIRNPRLAFKNIIVSIKNKIVMIRNDLKNIFDTENIKQRIHTFLSLQRIIKLSELKKQLHKNFADWQSLPFYKKLAYTATMSLGLLSALAYGIFQFQLYIPSIKFGILMFSPLIQMVFTGALFFGVGIGVLSFAIFIVKQLHRTTQIFLQKRGLNSKQSKADQAFNNLHQDLLTQCDTMIKELDALEQIAPATTLIWSENEIQNKATIKALNHATKKFNTLTK